MEVNGIRIVRICYNNVGHRFHAIYLRHLKNKFEYVFESCEYVILISGPLIVGSKLVVDQTIKNYFLIGYFVSIIGWFVFWVFVKKWGSEDPEEQDKIKLARPFTIGMFCAFVIIGILVLHVGY